MLDRARYADGDVEIRATTIARLADLPVVGTKPASTAARDAPMAAPSRSATGSMYFLKFSPFCMARPPEMMTLAEVSSGRSDLATRSSLNEDSPGLAAAEIFSTGAEPFPDGAWKMPCAR